MIILLLLLITIILKNILYRFFTEILIKLGVSQRVL